MELFNRGKKYDRILCISDQHFPYAHPDILPFLKECNRLIKPTIVVNLGDEVDAHAMSFHDHDPDLHGPSDELTAARKGLKPLMKLFPEMELLESNHGSMVYRQGKAKGIPREYFKHYREILHAPSTWRWHDELIINTASGPVMFRHQFKKDPLLCAQQMAMSVVQGHFHESFDIQFASSPERLLWSMTSACLIDKSSLAFAYNKTNTKRPIIGTSAVMNGQPRLIPMVLDKQSRWIGKIY